MVKYTVVVEQTWSKEGTVDMIGGWRGRGQREGGGGRGRSQNTGPREISVTTQRGSCKYEDGGVTRGRGPDPPPADLAGRLKCLFAVRDRRTISLHRRRKETLTGRREGSKEKNAASLWV